MAELTPMMKQYLEIKKDNPDSILFFRLGDFYEMFADDAKLASKELDLTLTSRDHGKHQKPAAASPITPASPILPVSSPRATRWPSASRWRIPPPPRAW